jgi:hypothetical protein
MDVEFRYPLDPQPRMFLFTDGGPWEPGGAETAVIAAKLLRRVWSDTWNPMLPVVVLTGPRYGDLSAEVRDMIWTRWGVPVYEFLTDRTGAVLASECDAHEGLHVHSPSIEAEARECGCGITGPMLPIGVRGEMAAA